MNGLAPKALFVAYEIDDPHGHREFNAYHQLDHRPENLALSGVAWGDRWVRSPDCQAVSTVNAVEFGGVQYLNMYWFRPPLDEAMRQFAELGERSYQDGRNFLGRTFRFFKYFDVVRGFVHPRVDISVAAVPIRPHHGVYLSLWQIDLHDESGLELARRQREKYVPAMLGTRGVAGAYTLASDEFFGWNPQHQTSDKEIATSGISLSSSGGLGYRAQIFFLDEDPVECAKELAEHERVMVEASASLGNPAQLVFASPLRTIVPWKWDWFDDADR